MGVAMRAATVEMDDAARSRTHAQIVWESQQMDHEKLNELQIEVRQLRAELELAKAELAKAIHWCATHWAECHAKQVSESEWH